MAFDLAEFVGNALWTLGGAVYGTPFSAAMGVLPAQTGEGISLRNAVADARHKTDWQIWAKVRGSSVTRQRTVSSDSDGDLGKLIFVAIAAIGLVTLYLRYVEVVATSMLIAAALTLLMSAVVLLILYLRGVIDGHRAGWSITGTVALAAGGVAVSIFLLAPPLQDVLASARNESGGVLKYFGQLSLQFCGALICFGVLIGSIGLCIAHVTAALEAAGGWGSGWLWRFLFWCNRWATFRRFGVALWIAMLCALALCSGLAYTGLEQLQHVQLPTQTSAP